jgi:hypothetical protein
MKIKFTSLQQQKTLLNFISARSRRAKSMQIHANQIHADPFEFGWGTLVNNSFILLVFLLNHPLSLVKLHQFFSLIN